MLTRRRHRLFNQWLLIFFLASYVIYIFCISVEGEQDFYPYFGWRLFTHPPRYVETIQIRIYEINNEAIPDGHLLPELIQKKKISTTTTYFPYYQYAKIGQKYFENPTAVRSSLRNLLKNSFPQISKVKYKWEFQTVDAQISTLNQIILYRHTDISPMIVETLND